MRAIAAEVQNLARSGQCEEAVAIDFVERLRVTEEAPVESHESLHRLGRLVGGVAKEPESSH